MISGYGSIYGSTNGGEQPTVNFTAVADYIYAIEQLKDRALARGGVMEGFGCAAEAVREFPDRDTPTEVFAAYSARVVAAGGTTEASACMINELQTLRL